MIDIGGQRITRNCEGVTRRDFLRVGALGLGGLTVADLFRLRAMAAETTPTGGVKAPKAKSVIQLWMGGGPAHVDTWDPKPDVGEDVTGPLRKPITTNVDGVRIGELMPLLAKQAHRYTICRSMTHGNNGHETATYIVQTGTMPSNDLVYPAVGAVVALKREEAGYAGPLPPYITLTTPLGRFSEAGFLGGNYQTFATGGDPAAREFTVQGLVAPRGMTDARVEGRRALLKSIDGLARQMENGAAFEGMEKYQEKAYGLMLGPARRAFDLSQEPDALRDRYGRNRFGQSCLLARRLVEHGVPFVTVHMGGWDTHRDHFPSMNRLVPTLDAGFATLLEDLAQRGLLESTIVVWYGEFGRTPKVHWEPPWNGGRHHYGSVFSAVVAGGGFKGGQVLGASDAKAEKVKDRPVYPWDLSASMYQLLGIDPTGRLPHPQGCLAYVTPLAKADVPSGGLLKEIM